MGTIGRTGGLMIDWDSLIKREGAAVWRTVYRIVRNQADAEECFQETFLAAVEVADRQRVENWPGLLQRLATARSIDRLRRRVRRMRREEVAELRKRKATSQGRGSRPRRQNLPPHCGGRCHKFPCARRRCFACMN